MATRLDIANAALGLAGVSQRLDDYENPTSEEARAVRSHYEKNVDSALRQHDWNFATRTRGLSPMGGSLSGNRPLADTESVWLRPLDALRVMSVYDSRNRRVEFKEDIDVNERAILIVDQAPDCDVCNGTHYARYVYRAEPNVWSADFRRLVELMLAVDLSRQLRPSNTENRKDLMEATEEAMKMAARTNAVEGGSLIPSNDIAREIQELALTLSGVRDPAGRQEISTSGEERFVRQFYELDRQAFLTQGEFSFSRRYLELRKQDPQIDHPSSAGYRSFYFHYPDDDCILDLKETYIRYTNYDMIRVPWTLVDAGVAGQLILMNVGLTQGVQYDVEGTGVFAIDEPDLSKWTPIARRAFAYKLAGSIAMATSQPAAHLAMLAQVMDREIARARSTGLQALGQRDDETTPTRSRFEHSRMSEIGYY